MENTDIVRVLYMSMDSWSSGHIFWDGFPKLCLSVGESCWIDSRTAEKMIDTTYNIDKLFPKLAIDTGAGCKRIKITETDNGYLIEELEML